MSTPSSPPEGMGEAPAYPAPKPTPKQNPAFRMIGMPNFRLKLPSRNWLIFISITCSFAAAITYDRRQKKAAQKKWCDLVSHIAQQPLPVNQMPRKLTIFLSAQPGDGIRPSREYFKEYIKPVLAAAAMDYDVIEGRKEGDVRYGTAEQIRRLRRRKGEKGDVSTQEEMDREQVVERLREQLKINPEPAVRGDVVIGRHTWKEYIRGLHEGWLGPLDEASLRPEGSALSSDEASISAEGDADASPEKPMEEKVPTEEEKKPLSPTHAYIPTSAYSSSPASPHLPVHLEPSAPIPHRHILGFFNSPIRIYRFLNQRHLADSIGRETAAVVLGFSRPYDRSSSFASESSADLDASPDNPIRAAEDDGTANETVSAAPTPTSTTAETTAAATTTATATVQTNETWEQQSLLQAEEADWHKSVRKPRGDDVERVWLDDVVMDARIGERMRRFQLAPEEEERAERIGQGREKTRAVEVQDLRKRPVVVDGS